MFWKQFEKSSLRSDHKIKFKNHCKTLPDLGKSFGIPEPGINHRSLITGENEYSPLITRISRRGGSTPPPLPSKNFLQKFSPSAKFPQKIFAFGEMFQMLNYRSNSEKSLKGIAPFFALKSHQKTQIFELASQTFRKAVKWWYFSFAMKKNLLGPPPRPPRSEILEIFENFKIFEISDLCEKPKCEWPPK